MDKNNLINVEPEYVYITIPAEYICVYHRIMVMLSDFGEDMLKDCKAGCNNRNAGVIECFNMFNAAVAAKKLHKDKLAEVIIKYVKAKINQLYKGKDNSPSLVFPIDEHGDIKAFVSCGERPRFYLNPDDGELYEHKFNNGFDEHFNLSIVDRKDSDPIIEKGLTIKFEPRYELARIIHGEVYNDHNEDAIIRKPSTIDNNNIGNRHPHYHAINRFGTTHIIEHEGHTNIEELIGEYYNPCGDLYIYHNGIKLDPKDVDVHLYFDKKSILHWHDVVLTKEDEGEHTFKIVVNHLEETKIVDVTLTFKIPENENTES